MHRNRLHVSPLVALALVSTSFAASDSRSAPAVENPAPAVKDPAALAAIPGPTLALVENVGQWDSPALFHGRLDEVEVHLLPGAVQFQLSRPDLDRAIAIRVSLEGGDPDCEPRGEGLRPDTRSYFRGKDQSRWATDVRSFSSALYRDLAPGLDLRVREGLGRMEWDLLLDAGVSGEGLVLRCDGAEDIAVDDEGSLVIETEIGAIRMSLPTSWTVAEDGTTEPVRATYVRIDEQRFRFEVAGRDRDEALVIDPGVEWASYLGGSELDVVLGTRQAANGDLVVTGFTRSPDFPTTAGAYQPSGSGGDEAFVSVFDSSGTTLLHSTYLAGAGLDGALALDLTPTGEVVVTGYTRSTDFPTTAGAYQTSKGTGFDAFVARLSADLMTLEHSTYFGDAGAGGRDWATEVAVDAAGPITICGVARADLPITPGAAQGTFGGFIDVFVARIDPAGGGSSDLLWCTYLGGSGDESFNNPFPGSANSVSTPDLALGGDGSVTVAGVTRSQDFPTTAGAFQEVPLQGNSDAFVARISADGSTLEYATLLGGSSLEVATALSLDAQGRAVVGGATLSGNFPVSPGALQPNLDASGTDGAWIAMVSSDGSALEYGTYLGGSGIENVICLDLEPTGAVIASGLTQSPNFPVTPTASQPALSGTSDAFLVRIDTTHTGSAQLAHSTYFGGSEGEDVWDLRALGSGRVLIGGATSSSDVPMTAGSFGPTYSGGVDAVVAVLDLGDVATRYCSPAVVNSTGIPASITAAGSDLAADNDLTLEATDLPQMSTAFFLTSQDQGLVLNPGGSQGNLCLGGSIGRYVGPGQIQNSGTAGTVSLALDLTSTPTPTGLVAVQAGETWNFQAWFRDSLGGSATSNFTDAVSVTFR
ncbi:MAG: hypothetical protein AAF957_13780 [Planctomycetota bacterium]